MNKELECEILERLKPGQQCHKASCFSFVGCPGANEEFERLAKKSSTTTYPDSTVWQDNQGREGHEGARR